MSAAPRAATTALAALCYIGGVIQSADLDRVERAFPVVTRLPAVARERVLKEAEPLAVDAGRVLFDVGDSCDGFGMIVAGRIRVSAQSRAGRELVLYRVRQGESCTVTASCLLSGSPYPARGIVEDPVDGVYLQRGLFRQLVDSCEPFRDFVFSILTARIDQLMEIVTEVAFHKLDLRLASRLIELGPVIEMTHQHLADEIGSTREMVSRILEAFADRGWVLLGRKRVELLDPEALRNEIDRR
jgi:CRP/FNR family transcriptional regulator